MPKYRLATNFIVTILVMSWLGLHAAPQQSVAAWTVQFSSPSGFYQQAVEVRLSAPKGCEIYFTYDGAWPSRKAHRYTQPFLLRQSRVIRAVAYRGKQAGPCSGASYLINEPASSLPIVSIGLGSGTLFDPQKGLFTRGSRREVVGHIDFFDHEGKNYFNGLIGFRLFGGISRMWPQKSLALVARKAYGQKRITYPIFGKHGPERFKHLVLRNGGSDWGRAQFRDGLITSIAAKWEVDVQAYQPAHVYINGKYWGMYDLREKINRFFLNDHHNIDKDSIDLLEHYWTRRCGSRRKWVQLLNFVETHDLSQAENYAWVLGEMDIMSFIDHQIAQIYFDNRDAGGNIRYWRPQTPDGRWRWILFDTDFGMGLHDPQAYAFNSLAFHTAANGPKWPNPPWSTLFLRKLLANSHFKRAFLNRFADRLNTDLRAEKVVAKVDSIAQMLAPEMPRHQQRWHISPKTWARQVATVRQFAQERPYHMQQHLMQFFNTGQPKNLEIEASEGGQVLLNDNLQVSERFRGTYFANLPLRLQAIPKPGYQFSHWQGLGRKKEDAVISLKLKGDITIVQAVFKKFKHPLAKALIINEACPSNPKSGDWVELYNPSREAVSVSNWQIRDRDGKKFRLPALILPPKAYLVLVQKEEGFRHNFPECRNLVPGMALGLNKRHEYLQLLTPDGTVVDEYRYELPPQDSIFTYARALPEPGTDAKWQLQQGPGSPGGPNPFYLKARLRSKQASWLRLGVIAAVLLVLGNFVVKRKS